MMAYAKHNFRRLGVRRQYRTPCETPPPIGAVSTKRQADSFFSRRNCPPPRVSGLVLRAVTGVLRARHHRRRPRWGTRPRRRRLATLGVAADVGRARGCSPVVGDPLLATSMGSWSQGVRARAVCCGREGHTDEPGTVSSPHLAGQPRHPNAGPERSSL